ncbi:MAG TPA: AI-2E family transporter [Thermoanaerobaculia bacterium]|nr:AI-2E family transporter [Thermoanaerobaculia bacterium]
MRLELSERQRSTIAAALTTVAACVLVLAVGALLFLVGLFVTRFSNVFLPLAVAAVLALVVRPFFVLLRRKMPASLALVCVFLSVLVPLGLFGWFFGAMAVGQIADLIENGPAMWERFRAGLAERWPQAARYFDEQGLEERLRTAVSGQEQQLLKGLQSGLEGVWDMVKRVGLWIGTLLTWAVLPVYFAFFLLVDPRERLLTLDDKLVFLKKETRDDVEYLARQFVEILVSFFRGQLIVAFLQGCLFALGFSVVGLRYGLLLGFVLGFLNVIPYLGSIVGMAVALPLAFFQEGGGGTKVILVVVVFTIVQMIEGYLLTPKIMGDRTGLHPVAIIVAVFFWGSALGGIAGMILAIPLTAFLVVFWRLAREKIGEVV